MTSVLRTLAAAIACIATVACGRSPEADRPRIVIDGQFDDWEGAPVLIADPEDAWAAAVDLRDISVRDDEQWLYVTIDWAREVNAHAMPGSVRVIFDTDGNESTGAVVHGMAGVDAVVELSERESAEVDGYGSGSGVRPVLGSGPQPIESGYLVDMIVAPSIAAARIELRLRRGASIPGVPALWTGRSTRIMATFEDASGVADETLAADYRFQTDYSAEAVGPALAEAADVARPAAATRVMAWNVSEHRFLDEAAAFRRVLNALDPDVVLLDEVYRDSTVDALEALLNEPPLARSKPWRVALGLGGGRQKTAVATRLPMRAEPALTRVDYAVGTLEDLDQRRPGFSSLIQVEREAGLAASGAWVTVEGRDVLFVPFDLQSGGYAGSVRDSLRMLQAGLLGKNAQAALRKMDRTAIILGGDANAVGSVRPLRSLQLASLYAPLTIADARHLASGSVYTWRNDGDRFPPGRLDYLLYGGDGLELVRAFPFEPEELTETALAALGLQVDDARRVSDHLPIVGDFRFAASR